MERVSTASARPFSRVDWSKTPFDAHVYVPKIRDFWHVHRPFPSTDGLSNETNEAFVAQWQCVGLVNQRSRVQSTAEALFTFLRFSRARDRPRDVAKRVLWTARADERASRRRRSSRGGGRGGTRLKKKRKKNDGGGGPPRGRVRIAHKSLVIEGECAQSASASAAEVTYTPASSRSSSSTRA